MTRSARSTAGSPSDETARSLRDGRRFRYPRSARVTRGSEIRALLRDGARRRCGPLELVHATAAGGRSRAGIIVPRYGRTIVQRNRLKRRLRECVRTAWLPDAPTGEAARDILVRARPAAYDVDLPELLEALWRCAEGAA